MHRSGAADPRHASKRPVPVTFVAALIVAVGVYNVVDGVVVLVNGGDNSKLAEASGVSPAPGQGSLAATKSLPPSDDQMLLPQ